MNFFKNLLKKISGLDTLEKKSFWTIGPIVVVVGLLSILTTSDVYGSTFVVLSAGLCVVAPIIIMAMCWRRRNYHFAYPCMCICVAAFIVPIVFLINGGFNSGMPIFCAGATVLCTFCYEKKWRFISFFVSVIANVAVFFYSKFGFGTANEVDSNWVENDIILSYVMVVIALFMILNMILNESRIYEKGSEVLSSYVDLEIKQKLIEQATQGGLKVDGVSVRVTVLFADISRFTTITEHMDPVVASKYLNTFLRIADECVHANNGIIDKYIGDCVMAYWVDPDKNGTGIIPAIKCVMDMREKLYAISQNIYEQFQNEMDFSAGIEYGDVVLGNIGSASRMDFTIIGDAVNTASRIQGLASRGELLVSESVTERFEDMLDLTPIKETHYLRGKTKPMVLYRVNKIVGDPESQKMLKAIGKSRFGKFIATKYDSYTLYVCGCRGAFPVSGMRYSEFGGETSCYLLRYGNYAIIIDCGTGLANAKPLLEGCTKIDILLTHVHYDHILGLLNPFIFPEEAEIRMLGHFGGWAGKNTVRDFLDTPYWPSELREMQTIDVTIGHEYRLDPKVSAMFVRSDHPDGGTLIRLLVGEQKICFFADLENPEYISTEIARDADLLFCDGMYDEEDAIDHTGEGHCTWQGAVRYAMSENVHRLIVTHHSPEYGDHDLKKLEARAKEMFPHTVFARTSDMYIIE